MKKQVIIGFMTLGMAAAASAQEGESRGYLGRAKDFAMQWTPYVGLGAGYTGYSDELDVEGVPATAKILGSYDNADMTGVFDLGVGFQNQRFSQEAATDRNVQSTVLEAAYRYRWDNGLQAGAVWNTLFNEGDAYGANQADAQFIGLQALQEIPVSTDWLMRAGGRYMTDVNVDGTWIHQVMAEVQLGWNPAGRKVSRPATANRGGVAPDLAPGSPEARSANNQPAEPLMSAERPMTAREYDARRDLLLFELDSAALDNSEQGKLEKLAAALSDNKGLVRQIEVVGYADPSGPADYNMKLSEQRAVAVRQALQRHGVGPNQVRVIARGEANPIPNSYEKSRRVELKFRDVKDERKLEQIVREIQ